MKHTPGTWKFNKDGDLMRGKEVVFTKGIRGMIFINPTDKSLVESAPELLKACKLLVDWEFHNPNTIPANLVEVMLEAKEAIRKAEGRE